MKPSTPQMFSSVKEAVKSTFNSKRRASCSIVPVDDSNNRPQLHKGITKTVPLRDISEAEEVDISQYTQEDLERLRVEDPFLYYSIPEMKQRLYGNDSSAAVRNNRARRVELWYSSRSASCPELSNDDSDNNGLQPAQRRGSVTRARRLSVEPHPSVVMKNIMDEMMIGDDEIDSDIDEEDELLIQALANDDF